MERIVAECRGDEAAQIAALAAIDWQPRANPDLGRTLADDPNPAAGDDEVSNAAVGAVVG